MNTEQATLLLNVFLPDVEQEAKTTRRVIDAVTQPGYKPDPTSRSAIELAWHLASSEVWFLDSIAKGEFGMDEMPLPATVKNGSDVAAWYDRSLPASIAKVKAMTPDQLAKPVGFFGMFDFPAVNYLMFLIKHSVHHRGQLAAYLRPMGSKVPNIYGGSADEPMQMPAGA